MGDLLYPGDGVEVGKDGSVTINYVASGQEERVPGGARFSVGKTESAPHNPQVKIKKRKVVLPVTEYAQTGSLRLRGAGPAPAPAGGAVAGPAPSQRSFAVDGPSNTSIVEERPAFRWEPMSAADAYRVTLYTEAQAQPLWHTLTTRTEIPYPPAEAPLKFNRHYRWTVEAMKGGGVVAEKSGCFDLPEQADVTDMRAQIKSFKESLSADPGDAATRLAFIFFLESRGLFDDAMEQYKGLRSLRKESDSLRAREESVHRMGLLGCQ